jgi:hypothetical protein
VERRFADFFDLAQVLVIGALGAIEQHLRQTRFGVTGSAPFADLLLGVDVREAVRELQVKHRQRNQSVAFTIGGGFFQQAFGFVLFGFGGTGFGHQ